jgi:hypothetical protein
MFRHTLSAALVCLALALPAAPGAAPEKPAPKVPSASAVDEQLFLLYTLGYFAEPLRLEQSTAGKDYRLRVYQVAVRASVLSRTRKMAFDRLRRYVERQTGVDERITKLFKAVDREIDLTKDYSERCVNAYNKYARTVRNNQMIASRNVGAAGLAFGLASFFGRGGNERQAIGDGLRAAAAAALREQTRLSAAERAAWQALGADLAEADSYVKAKREEYQKEAGAGYPKVAGDMRTENNWAAAQFSFDRGLKTTGERLKSHNPFIVAEAASVALAKKDATTDELLESAKACQEAAARVPEEPAAPGKKKDKAVHYTQFRAMLLCIGGQLANRAAEKDLGTTGLADALTNPPKAGPLAKELWEEYIKNEPLDANINDGVMHQYVLACAYAGKVKLSYRKIITPLKRSVVVVRPNRRQPGRPVIQVGTTTNPLLWYDCARVCSLSKDAQMACLCLDAARRLGFRDFERAKTDPDLAYARQNKTTAAYFRSIIP